MTPSRVSWVALAAVLLFLASAGLPAQEPTARAAVSAPVVTGAPAPDVANGVENMYVPPAPHAPFSAKSVASLTRTLRDGSISYYAFFSLLALSLIHI